MNFTFCGAKVMNFTQKIALLALKNVFFIQDTQNTHFVLHFARFTWTNIIISC